MKTDGRTAHAHCVPVEERDDRKGEAQRELARLRSKTESKGKREADIPCFISSGEDDLC